MAKASDMLGQVQQAIGEGTQGANREDAAAVRRQEAIALRLAGMSYADIGARLNISGGAARDMIQRSMERAEAQGVSILRAEENARLDKAQMAIWGQVIQGDLKAIATFLQISNARSKLNGLYAPTQVQVSMTIRQEMEEALQNLEALVLYENTPQPGLREIEGRDVTYPE